MKNLKSLYVIILLKLSPDYEFWKIICPVCVLVPCLKRVNFGIFGSIFKIGLSIGETE